LIEGGVDLIAGSHPHCMQPLDFYHGRPIIYSLCNLVLTELATHHPRSGLAPVMLDAGGFPQATAATGEFTSG
jgi:poly-gamma-glutamate capsule biosynthesis protein CapA/YwtB (metallophosphatase superfamily)